MSNTTASSSCAACKYNRKKCTPDCPLAPYFPADQPQQFLNVHNTFGTANVLKLLNTLHPSDRTTAMNAAIEDAKIRTEDPVGGCHRRIRHLEGLIQLKDAEIARLIRQQPHIIYLPQAQEHASSHRAVNPMSIQDMEYHRRPTSSVPPVLVQDQEYPVYIDQDYHHNTTLGGFNVPRSSAATTVAVGIPSSELNCKESTHESRDKTVVRAEVDSVQQEQEKEKEQDLKDAASQFSLANTNDQSM